MTDPLRADLHVHTLYSPDSTAPLRSIVNRCLATGVNCLAITDHNTIEGALEMKRHAPFKIIVGEEISSTDGDIIGLFLSEGIPRGLTPAATVKAIRAQGGLVMVPHPFDRLRPSALGREAFEGIANDVDVIETFNARNLFGADDALASETARRLSLLPAAVTDAHVAGELGRAYNRMPDFGESPQAFLQALALATPVTRRTRTLHRMAPTLAKARKFLGRRLPAIR